MNVIQTMRLARSMLASREVEPSEKAVMFCWLMHTVGDIQVLLDIRRGRRIISAIQTGRNRRALGQWRFWDGTAIAVTRRSPPAHRLAARAAPLKSIYGVTTLHPDSLDPSFPPTSEMRNQGQYRPGDRVRLRGVITHTERYEIEVICGLGPLVAVHYVGDHRPMVAIVPANCLERVE